MSCLYEIMRMKADSQGIETTNINCQAICGQARDCCGRTCTASCSTCQSLSPRAPALAAYSKRSNIDGFAPQAIVPRIKHNKHACDKLLGVCGHQCSGNCEANHTHPLCQAPCLQQCAHKSCTRTCKTPCAPCEPIAGNLERADCRS